MAQSTVITPSRADWYADPHDPELIRYWDGREWTHYTLLMPHGWASAGTGARLRWWQTWWAVVPGLLFCAPLGLVGLWRRPGAGIALKSGLTAAAVALLAIVIVTDDSSTSTDDTVAATITESAPMPSSAPSTPVAEPVPTPPPATPEPEVLVPELEGLSQQQAKRSLLAAGLVVGEITKVPSARPRGTVLRQSAKDGTSLLVGAGIAMTVAVPFPKVPNIVGGTRAQAVRGLEKAGFRVRVTQETRTSGRDGAVVSQLPAATERLKPGSVVTVVVANVVRPVAPPPPPPAPSNCTAGYSPCLAPASDYDCAGGSGDGPAYASGPIRVTGSDPYRLDADGDGVACES